MFLKVLRGVWMVCGVSLGVIGLSAPTDGELAAWLREADLVVVGTVKVEKTSPRTDRVTAGGWPTTKVILEIHETLKGSTPTSTILPATNPHAGVDVSGGRHLYCLKYDQDLDAYLLSQPHSHILAVEDSVQARRILASTIPKPLQDRTLVGKISFPDLGFTWKSDPKSLIVAAVRPSSAAAEGKFEAGDVILKVEGTRVTTPAQFHERMGDFATGARLKAEGGRKKELMTWLLVVPGGLMKGMKRTRSGPEGDLERSGRRRLANGYWQEDLLEAGSIPRRVTWDGEGRQIAELVLKNGRAWNGEDWMVTGGSLPIAEFVEYRDGRIRTITGFDESLKLYEYTQDEQVFSGVRRGRLVVFDLQNPGSVLYEGPEGSVAGGEALLRQKKQLELLRPGNSRP